MFRNVYAPTLRGVVDALLVAIVWCFCASADISAAATATEPQIEWQVYNRFRFYQEPQAFRRYLYAAAAEAKKEDLAFDKDTDNCRSKSNWILCSERALQQDFEDAHAKGPLGWASDNLGKNDLCWDREHFEFVKNDVCGDNFAVPNTHRILLRAPGLAAAQCSWHIETFGDIPANYAKLANENGFTGGLHNATTCDCPIKLDEDAACAQAEIPYSADETKPTGANISVIVTLPGQPPATSKPLPVIVKDYLVVGMGDSFGAGVGNPDRPARIGRFDSLAYGSVNSKQLPVRLDAAKSGTTSSQAFVAAAPQWLDVRCFRSQYGPEFKTALHLAITSPHASVTYLDFACNGARILEGLMAAKALHKSDGFAYDGQVPPQISAVADLVCSSSDSAFNQKILLTAKPNSAACKAADTICEYNNAIYRDYNFSSIALKGCSANSPHVRRPIDYVLLSIGGNDIGFAPMVADVVLTTDEVGIIPGSLADYLSSRGDLETGDIGLKRLGYLRSKYEKLRDAFSKLLPIRDNDQSRIFVASYPMPIAAGAGLDGLCDATEQNRQNADASMDVHTALGGFLGLHGPKPQLRSVLVAACSLNRWRFSWFAPPSDDESKAAEQWFKDGPCKSSGDVDVSTRIPWTYVSGFSESYWPHGFCAGQSAPAPSDADCTPSVAGEPKAAERLNIPTHDPGEAPNCAATPYDLSDLRPYHSRRRWVRTMNDAFLVTNWHGSGAIGTFENAVLAESTGALHATAEGYAAIADSMFHSLLSHLCANKGAAEIEAVDGLSTCTK
ncbi:hypothetical protein [Methylocapsa sp. S129]|uniref:hypothetical protein n=1 Tax=Methylocapsa sp. S129 TaxID=1641869 RepID=UPI00131B704F|nr:hypothetical protein [Methylocapsa sp. S129]